MLGRRASISQTDLMQTKEEQEEEEEEEEFKGKERMSTQRWKRSSLTLRISTSVVAVTLIVS